MNSNFEWQTEEENGWEPIEPASRPSPTPHRGPWRVLLLVGVLLGGVALVIHWQFDRRLETVTGQVEADVLSSHNLVNRAAARQDWALLLPLISGRDPAWTDTFGQLVDAGLLYDRPFLTLPLAAPDEAYVPLSPAGDRYRQIVINPEMNTAELHFLQAYEPGSGQETVLLEHIAIYRKGGARWLLSPPDADFWGEWQMTQTKWFTLFYPERDKVMAEQLAADLTAVLDDVCPQITPLPCFVLRSELKIWLDPDPATLLALTDPATLYDGDAWLNLPAPTLVGLPTDEAGYQALLQGYSAAITAAMITYLAGYECCEYAPIYQVFMEYELSQLGLWPWPVTPDTYKQVINQAAYQDDLLSFWHDTSFQRLQAPDGWRLYAFADFVMHQANAPSPIAVLAALDQTRQPVTWLAWLTEVVPVAGFARSRRTVAWWTYAQAQMAASQGAPPIPLPAQDLLLTCPAGNAETESLYRYRLADNTWHKEAELAGRLLAVPLPDDTAVLLQTFPRDNETAQPLLWRAGAGVAMTGEAHPLALSWGQADPTGRYVLIFTLAEGGGAFQPLLVDTSACDAAGCALTPLPGIPVWSPDGAQTLVALTSLGGSKLSGGNGRVLTLDNPPGMDDLEMFRGDSVAQPASQLDPPTLRGNAPFWVNGEIYGYVQTIHQADGGIVQQLILSTTTDDLPRPILGTADLLSAIPETLRPFPLTIRYVLPLPGRPEWLVVMAASKAGDFTFLVNWRERVIENRLHFDHVNPHAAGFSADGRYLLTTGIPIERLAASPDSFSYFLHDLAANQTQTFAVHSAISIPAYQFDWSADGRWLAHIMDNGYQGVINLVAPAENYQKLIVHENLGCSSLAWVNPITR